MPIKNLGGFTKELYDKQFTHICLRCGGTWESHVENPYRCVKCRSRVWNTGGLPKVEAYRPLPQFDHTENKSLLFIGSRCPYCRGTTGIDGIEGIQFCYSCDYSWDLKGNPLGVKVGIGVRLC